MHPKEEAGTGQREIVSGWPTYNAHILVLCFSLSLSLSLSLPLVVVHAVLHLPKVWMVQPMSNVLLLARKEVIGDNNLMSLHHEFVHQV